MGRRGDFGFSVTYYVTFLLLVSQAAMVTSQTVNVPLQNCKTFMFLADSQAGDGDGFLSADAEYIAFLNRMSLPATTFSAAGLAYESIPVELKDLFMEYANMTLVGKIDIHGATPATVATSETQVANLESFCSETQATLNSLLSTTAPIVTATATVPPAAATVYPTTSSSTFSPSTVSNITTTSAVVGTVGPTASSSSAVMATTIPPTASSGMPTTTSSGMPTTTSSGMPTTALATQATAATIRPTYEPTTCKLRMVGADSNPRDNLLSQEEFVVFLNELSGGAFSGQTYAMLDPGLQTVFVTFATGMGGTIPILGAIPAQESLVTAEAVAALNNLCTSASYGIQDALSPPTASTIPPSTYATYTTMPPAETAAPGVSSTDGTSSNIFEHGNTTTVVPDESEAGVSSPVTLPPGPPQIYLASDSSSPYLTIHSAFVIEAPGPTTITSADGTVSTVLLSEVTQQIVIDAYTSFVRGNVPEILAVLNADLPNNDTSISTNNVTSNSLAPSAMVPANATLAVQTVQPTTTVPNATSAASMPPTVTGTAMSTGSSLPPVTADPALTSSQTVNPNNVQTNPSTTLGPNTATESAIPPATADPAVTSGSTTTTNPALVAGQSTSPVFQTGAPTAGQSFRQRQRWLADESDYGHRYPNQYLRRRNQETSTISAATVASTTATPTTTVVMSVTTMPVDSTSTMAPIFPASNSTLSTNDTQAPAMEASVANATALPSSYQAESVLVSDSPRILEIQAAVCPPQTRRGLQETIAPVATGTPILATSGPTAANSGTSLPTTTSSTASPAPMNATSAPAIASSAINATTLTMPPSSCLIVYAAYDILAASDTDREVGYNALVASTQNLISSGELQASLEAEDPALSSGVFVLGSSEPADASVLAATSPPVVSAAPSQPRESTGDEDGEEGGGSNGFMTGGVAAICVIVVLLCCGGGFYAWKKGMLDRFVQGGDAEDDDDDDSKHSRAKEQARKSDDHFGDEDENEEEDDSAR